MTAHAADPVTVVVLPYLSQAPIFIAIDEGYFEKEGIEIKRVDMKSSQPVVPGIMSGEFDMAMSIPSAGFFNAIARGGKGRVVGPGLMFAKDECSYAAYYGREGFDRDALTSGKDLKVKLSADATTFEGYLSEKMQEMIGTDAPSFEYLEMPAYTQGDALNVRSIDVAFTAEPWMSRFDQDNMGQIAMGAEEILPDAQYGTLMFSTRLTTDDVDLGVRLKRAIDGAISQYNEGKTDRNIEIIAANTGLDIELVKQACWATIPDDGVVRVDSIIAFQEWLLPQGLIDEVIPASTLIAKIGAE
jgi:NitT/TauT family transport system substrate-binding protein